MKNPSLKDLSTIYHRSLPQNWKKPKFFLTSTRVRLLGTSLTCVLVVNGQGVRLGESLWHIILHTRSLDPSLQEVSRVVLCDFALWSDLVRPLFLFFHPLHRVYAWCTRSSGLRLTYRPREELSDTKIVYSLSKQVVLCFDRVQELSMFKVFF